MALLAMGVAHAQAGATGQDQASSQESATPSRSEVVATGYLHTLLTAQREYQKKHDEYATSLRALVGSGSFTRRLAETDRRDYTVQFHSTGKAFSVALVPKQFDADHASFFMDETGVIRTEPDKIATSSSPTVRASDK